MFELTISFPLSVAVLVAAGGSLWVYTDASDRGMETADMWAVGFALGFFLLPILGGILVLAYYLQKRPPRYPDPTSAPQH